MRSIRKRLTLTKTRITTILAATVALLLVVAIPASASSPSIEIYGNPGSGKYFVVIHDIKFMFPSVDDCDFFGSCSTYEPYGAIYSEVYGTGVGGTVSHGIDTIDLDIGGIKSHQGHYYSPSTFGVIESENGAVGNGSTMVFSADAGQRISVDADFWDRDDFQNDSICSSFSGHGDGNDWPDAQSSFDLTSMVLMGAYNNSAGVAGKSVSESTVYDEGPCVLTYKVSLYKN